MCGGGGGGGWVCVEGTCSIHLVEFPQFLKELAVVGAIFVTFCLPSCTPAPSQTMCTLKENNLVPVEANSFIVDLFSEAILTIASV